MHSKDTKQNTLDKWEENNQRKTKMQQTSQFIVFYLLRIPLEMYEEDSYHFNWAIKRYVFHKYVMHFELTKNL